MTFPSAFYLKKTHSGESYQSTPSARVSMPRLLRGAVNFWISPALPRIVEKKKLILSDWTAGFWSDEKTNKIIGRLIELMDDGFEIYVWQQDKVTALNKQNLDKLKDISFRATIFPNNLTPIEQQCGFPRDETLALDDYWINLLISEDISSQARTLSVMEFMRLTNPQKELISDILKLANPPLEHFLVENNLISYACLAYFGEYEDKVIRHYKYLTLDNSIHLSELLADTAEISQYIKPHDVLSLDIEELEVSSDQLAQLLQKFPNLKQLSLNNCENLESGLQLSKNSLPQLDSLLLETSNICTKMLQSLLESAPRVKKLYICLKKNITHTLSLAENALPLLEEMNIVNINTSNHELQTIINSAPNLRKIVLNFFSDLELEHSLPDAALSKLEEITLYQTNLDDRGFKAILKGSLQLKKIYLSQCSNLKIEHALSPEHLAQLEEISLGQDNLSTLRLVNIFANAPKLKNLKLFERQTVDFFLIPEYSLIPLVEINFRNCNIGAQGLQALLRSTPKLKNIILFDCNHLNDDIIIPEHFLQQLTEIDLRNCNIGAQGLQTILKSAPELKKIRLFDCNHLNADIIIPEHFLQQLTEIELRNCNISAQGLQALLRSAPQLKKLDLFNCLHLKDTILIPEHALQHLTELQFRQCNISADGLKSLLLGTNHLKTLHLSRCIEIDFDTATFESKLTQLEVLYLEEINFSDINRFQDFLKTTNQLKKIHLLKCMAIKFDEVLREVKLPQLEIICLEQENFTDTNGLQTILEQSPKLQKIELINGDCLCDELVIEEESLALLQEIHLHHITISTQFLQSILKAAPNLKKIQLDWLYSHYKSLDEVFLCLPENIFLGPLIIHFEYASIGIEALEALKKAVPNVVLPYLHIKSHTYSLDSELAYLSNSEDSTMNASSSTWADADTSPQNTTYSLKRVFFSLSDDNHPDPSTYRLSVYNLIGINPEYCSPSHAFSLHNTADLQLEDCRITKLENDSFLHPVQQSITKDYYYGKHKFSSTHEWRALPSLAPNEELVAYHIDINVEVEFKYAHRDNLYYFRSHIHQPFTIDFILAVPKDSATIPNGHLIYNLITLIQSYGVANLQIDEPSTGRDYLNAILSQKVGACRHRTLVFKTYTDVLPHFKDIQTRIVYNECHSFVEILINGRWVACDLGGYPASLVIDETKAPKRPTASRLQSHAPIPLGYNVVDLKKALQRKKTLPPDNLLEYCQISTNARHNKRLIECAGAEEIDALHFAFQQYCRTTNKPVFYIHKPEELACSSPYIKRVSDDNGHLSQGPSGPLYAFFNTHPNGVLIINYGNFKNDDIVRFNSLLDKERQVDGINIPPKILIIGLLNTNNPDCIPGSDFYSRFGSQVETCPISLTALQKAVPPKPVNSDAPVDYIINLYQAADWKERLLGYWIPHKHLWHFQKGELERAVKQNAQSIGILNGPWHNPEFCRFWQEIAQHPIIDYEGTRISLEGITFSSQEGYLWEQLKTCVRLNDELPEHYHVLNPSTFGDFFIQFQVEDEQLIQDQGWIAKSCGTLSIFITAAINDDQWAMLLTECLIHKTTISVCCATDVAVPFDQIPNPVIVPSKLVIESSDIDVTIHQLIEVAPDSLVIDISECISSDLLFKITPIYQKDMQSLKFIKTQCALLKAIKEGQQVILKGHCRAELVNVLAEALLNPNYEHQLKLVTDNASLFNFLTVQKHLVDVQEKCIVLGNELDGLAPYFDQEPVAKLKARQCYLQRTPHATNSDDAWQGMLDIPAHSKDPGPIEVNYAQKQALFLQQRVKAITAVLQSEPYVFLTGLSGVGKSTFVMNSFCDKDKTLYVGESRLVDWAQDHSYKQKILFIDEANLSPSDWTDFHGLYNRKPTMLIHGQLYPLSKNHKVIFAGNPLRFGDERKFASFFALHGNAILFDPIPSNVLYGILETVLSGTFINPHIFIDVYRYLCKCSDTELLISPRELQMMALLSISFCRNYRDANPETVARYFAYHVAKNLVPQSLQNTFRTQFSVGNIYPELNLTLSDYHITPSRISSINMLNQFLQLRELRRTSKQLAIQSGGLGGIVLEGEPGIGKSEMVVKILESHGFKEHAIVNGFYRMQVSISLGEKETLLRKAFDEGAVVIIDEINSSPMMERLLNALLMGSTPEGHTPKKPGFMIIGTQNPCSMGGRRAYSSALKHRVMTIELPSYDKDELFEILSKTGLSENITHNIIKAYLDVRAQCHHHTTAPTFRDLLALAQQIQQPDEIEVELDDEKKTDCIIDTEPLHAFILHQVKQNGMALEHAAPELKKDISFFYSVLNIDKSIQNDVYRKEFIRTFILQEILTSIIALSLISLSCLILAGIIVLPLPDLASMITSALVAGLSGIYAIDKGYFHAKNIW